MRDRACEYVSAGCWRRAKTADSATYLVLRQVSIAGFAEHGWGILPQSTAAGNHSHDVEKP